MKKIKSIYSIFITSVFVAGMALVCSGCGSKKAVSYEYATISRQSIENTISTVGTLEAKASITVQSPNSGIVDAVLVKPNEAVKKGQEIAKVNTSGNPNAKSLVSVYSPVDGIIFAQSVNEGASVLGRGSPAATSLFTIVSDTSELNITAEIGEMDIPSITENMSVLVSFQAFPDKTFMTKVTEILPLATVGDTVTYTIKAEIQNAENTLRAGMTCNLDFIVQKESDVLCVPNAALRFTPDSVEKETDSSDKAKASSTNAVTSALTGGKTVDPKGEGKKANPYGHPTGDVSFGDPTEQKEEKAVKETKRTLWYEENGKLLSVEVKAGISDGIKTAVTAVNPDVKLEGMKIILREKE